MRDPLGWLAAAAGYSDGERWWEQMVEQRRDGAELFRGDPGGHGRAARAEAPADPDPIEAQREACDAPERIRAAEQRRLRRASPWSAGPGTRRRWPMLAGAKRRRGAAEGLPKVKVQATWVPWTYGRLAYHSGYGAGIESPGWYEHLWQASAAGCRPARSRRAG